MRAKRVYEFLKTGDVKSSLGIGRIAEIRELFRGVRIPDERYVITDTEVIFGNSLYLDGTSITKLPNGLSVEGDLVLERTTLKELPEGLNVKRDLDLRMSLICELPKGLYVGGVLLLMGTPITELPEDLIIGKEIYISPSQRELESYIRSSKFAKKLRT